VKAPHDAWIGLGANLDDPEGQVLRAFDELADLPGTRLTARSSLYRSEPVSDIPQDDYINAVARLQTRLEPLPLLDALQAIEQRHHRQRRPGIVNGPRTLDLDLLLFDDRQIDHERLIVPHPRLRQRRFVLVPMREIAPGLRIAQLGNIDALIDAAAPMRLQRIG
jgi:2-amino-4-hydroxy-6-hydroxymethyldihydropteridine diphosphokinase